MLLPMEWSNGSVLAGPLQTDPARGRGPEAERPEEYLLQAPAEREERAGNVHQKVFHENFENVHCSDVACSDF